MAGPNAGHFLFQGLRGLSGSLGQKFEQDRQRAEAQEQEQKERSQRFTKLVSAFDELGWMPKDVAMTKSLEQLEGVFEGKQLLGKLGESELKNKLTNLQIAEQEREAGNEQSFARAIGDATTTATPSAPGLIPQSQTASVPLTRTRLIEAFRLNPQAANSPAGRTLLAQAMQEDGQGTPYQPESFEVGGMRGIVSPRTGSIHLNAPNSGSMTFEQRIALMDRNALLRRKEAITKALSGFVTPDVKDFYNQELTAIDAKLASPKESGAAPAAATNPKDPLGLFVQ